MQLAACSAFLQILRNDLVPLGSYTQTFLQTILMAIDSRDLGKECIINGSILGERVLMYLEIWGKYVKS